MLSPDGETIAAAITERLAELFDGLDGDIVGDCADLMHSFLERSADEIDAIERAVAADDAPSMRRYAHSLRGMAGNVGAHRLAARATEAEDAARDGRMPASTSVVAELRMALSEVEAAVAELYPRRTSR